MANWRIHEAKAHFSEVIERAQAEGPQVITRHGVERAVILSMAEFRRLSHGAPDFKAHLLGGPRVDEFDIPRSTDTGRDIEL